MPCVIDQDGLGRSILHVVFCLLNKTFKQGKIVKYNKEYNSFSNNVSMEVSLCFPFCF